jgi:PAS domain S-box-containing protein
MPHMEHGSRTPLARSGDIDGRPFDVAERSRLTEELRRVERELAARTRELARSTAQFRDVIERNADAIVVVDGDGAIRFANAKARELFGADPDDLLGTSFGFPLVTGDTTEIELRPRGVRPGRPEEQRIAEMRVVESEWEGKPACLATLRDITERRRGEQHERQLIRENEGKANLLAVVSHDLRTPLTAIIGYAELLELGVPEVLPAAAQQPVQRIRTAARHLLYLLNELLSFARLDAGRDEVSIQTVDLRDVAGDVAAVMQPLADAHGLRLRVCVPNEPLTVSTDPDKLRQVLLNLVGNAVKYTTTGEVELTIGEGEAQNVVACVRDTGVGISDEHLAHIFEPFWQVDPTQRNRDGGTGLGLSVVQRLVVMLSGTIHVTSAAGVGSTFTVILPREVPRAHRVIPPAPPAT